MRISCLKCFKYLQSFAAKAFRGIAVCVYFCECMRVCLCALDVLL